MTKLEEKELLVLIPKEVLNRCVLTPKAKLLLGYLISLNGMDVVTEKGYFYCTNEQIHKELGTTNKTLSRYITQLTNNGLINRVAGEKGKASEYRLLFDTRINTKSVDVTDTNVTYNVTDNVTDKNNIEWLIFNELVKLNKKIDIMLSWNVTYNVTDSNVTHNVTTDTDTDTDTDIDLDIDSESNKDSESDILLKENILKESSEEKLVEDANFSDSEISNNNTAVQHEEVELQTENNEIEVLNEDAVEDTASYKDNEILINNTDSNVEELESATTKIKLIKNTEDMTKTTHSNIKDLLKRFSTIDNLRELNEKMELLKNYLWDKKKKGIITYDDYKKAASDMSTIYCITYAKLTTGTTESSIPTESSTPSKSAVVEVEGIKGEFVSNVFGDLASTSPTKELTKREIVSILQNFKENVTDGSSKTKQRFQDLLDTLPFEFMTKYDLLGMVMEINTYIKEYDTKGTPSISQNKPITDTFSSQDNEVVTSNEKTQENALKCPVEESAVNVQEVVEVKEVEDSKVKTIGNSECMELAKKIFYKKNKK